MSWIPENWQISARSRRTTYLEDGEHLVEMVARGKKFELRPDGWDGEPWFADSAEQVAEALENIVDTLDDVNGYLLNQYLGDKEMNFREYQRISREFDYSLETEYNDEY